jgi:arylsulfatase A-like enzyme
VIFTSDNGPVLNDGYYDQAEELIGNHTPSGGLRGGKYSLFDAGTHVPFMVRWKGTIEPKVSDALVSQMDFTASFAALTRQENSTPDSENILDALLGKSEQGRSGLLLGQVGSTTYRKGDYVLIPPHNGAKFMENVKIETGRNTAIQLYNIKTDRGQQKNIAEQHPEIVEALFKEIEKIHSK